MAVATSDAFAIQYWLPPESILIRRGSSGWTIDSFWANSTSEATRRPAAINFVASVVPSAGIIMAAAIAMIITTINSSTNVNDRMRRLG